MAHFRALFNGVDDLIIDEVSMLQPALLEKLNIVAQHARGCKEFMGGVRVSVETTSRTTEAILRR